MHRIFLRFASCQRHSYSIFPKRQPRHSVLPARGLKPLSGGTFSLVSGLTSRSQQQRHFWGVAA